MEEAVMEVDEQAETIEVAAAEALPAVTTVAEWRRRAGAVYLWTLTSGVTIKARRRDLQTLTLMGVVSIDDLTALALAEGEVAPLPEDAPESEKVKAVLTATMKRMRALVPIAKAIAPEVVLDPPIVRGHSNGSGISVDDVPEDDLVQILLWTIGRGQFDAVEVVE